MNLTEKRLEAYDALLAAARGDIPADTLIRGGRILNVLTGEMLSGDIAIHKGFIASIFSQNRQATRVVDASGKIALPAFIDPHVHIESSMVLPPTYAQIVAASGTGTVLADPHEIVNVMGVEGFELMMHYASGLPIRLFFDIPTCVPASRRAESSGAEVRSTEVREMARLGGAKLGELMSFEDIISGEAAMTEIVKTGWELDLPRDAHFPMIGALEGMLASLSKTQKIGVYAGMLGANILRLRGLSALPYRILVDQMRQGDYGDLDAYLVALGLTADHETYGPEMQIKLDHGMRLMISAHSFAMPQLTHLFLQGIKKLRYKDAVGMCTDDIWPDALVEDGGMVGILRKLIKNGIDPIDAVRFATLNNAQRLAQAGIADARFIGALTPGMVADVVLVGEPLKDLKIDLVLHEGEVVAEDVQVTSPVLTQTVPPAALDTVRVAPVTEKTFSLAAPVTKQDGVVKTSVLVLPPPPALPFPALVVDDVQVHDGVLSVDGYITIAVFNRYGRNGHNPTLGLIAGYSLRDGAIASTVAHDSHNLIVLGTNRPDMALATNTVLEMHGGMVAVRQGAVLAKIPLPVGGLMSLAPIGALIASVRAFRDAFDALDLDPNNPIMPFALFSLPATPGAKVTDRGIWDPNRGTLVPLFPE